MALQSECHPVQFQTNYPHKKKNPPFSPSQVRTINLYRVYCVSREDNLELPWDQHVGNPKNQGFLPLILHGKSRNSACKIKWFAPFCLGSFRKIYAYWAMFSGDATFRPFSVGYPCSVLDTILFWTLANGLVPAINIHEKTPIWWPRRTGFDDSHPGPYFLEWQGNKDVVAFPTWHLFCKSIVHYTESKSFVLHLILKLKETNYVLIFKALIFRKSSLNLMGLGARRGTFLPAQFEFSVLG